MTDANAYFALDASDEATNGTWFDVHTGIAPIELVPGLEFRPIVGQKLAVNLVTFEPNTVAPLHAHSEEQIAYVLEGEFEFEVNGERRILRPGQAVAIPPNTPHSARTYDTRCVELDIFHPPRQGLLEAIRAQREGAGDTSGGQN